MQNVARIVLPFGGLNNILYCNCFYFFVINLALSIDFCIQLAYNKSIKDANLLPTINVVGLFCS